jgi:pimeloyl-ACP methyl ester carboxylesterase
MPLSQSTDAKKTVSACAPGSTATDGRAWVLGGALAYTIAGSGPVLLLVHGLGGTRQTWRHLIGPLSVTHTVIAADLPGHGDSDAPAGDYSLGAHATALRDLLVALGHRSASIVGHSLVGGVSLQFAYQVPQRTERLALIASGGLGPEVTALLRAAIMPGAETVMAGLSQLPTGVRTYRSQCHRPPWADGKRHASTWPVQRPSHPHCVGRARPNNSARTSPKHGGAAKPCSHRRDRGCRPLSAGDGPQSPASSSARVPRRHPTIHLRRGPLA